MFTKKRVYFTVLIISMIAVIVLNNIDKYVQVLYIALYISLFVFYGLLFIGSINWLRKFIIDYSQKSKKAIIVINALAIFATIYSLYNVTDGVLETAEENELVILDCAIYDKENNVIYEALIMDGCPSIEILENTDSKLSLSGKNDTTSKLGYGYIDLEGENKSYSHADFYSIEIFDINVEYFDNGMIDFYEVWQTEFQQVTIDDITYTRSFSTYAWVDNELTNDGFTSKRNYEFEHTDYTSMYNAPFEHYDFGEIDYTPSVMINAVFTTSTEGLYTMSTSVYDVIEDEYVLREIINAKQEGSYSVSFECEYGNEKPLFIDIDAWFDNYGDSNEEKSYRIFAYAPGTHINDLLRYQLNGDEFVYLTDYDRPLSESDYEDELTWRQYFGLLYARDRRIDTVEDLTITSMVERKEMVDYLYKHRIARAGYYPSRVDELLNYENYYNDVMVHMTIMPNNIYYEYMTNYEKLEID